jgi:hypothetical protein
VGQGAGLYRRPRRRLDDAADNRRERAVDWHRFRRAS